MNQVNMEGKTLYLEDENMQELKEQGHTTVITAHGDEVWLEKVNQ